MKPTDVLVIVDMQIKFSAAHDADLIARIRDAATQITRTGGRVVQIAYDGCGEPTMRIPGADLLWKNANCGGDQVYSWLLGAGLVSEKLRVTMAGVNGGLCVYQTATGLAERLSDEHALCEHVFVDLSLCGDGGPYTVRFVQSARTKAAKEPSQVTARRDIDAADAPAKIE